MQRSVLQGLTITMKYISVKLRSLRRSQRLMLKCVASAAYAPGFSSIHLGPTYFELFEAYC